MVSAKEKSGNSTNLLFRVKKGLKKKKNKAFELDVDACMMIIYDPTLVDVALQKEEGFEIEEEEEEEDLKNEFMGFDELNVKINQMRITEEGENCSWPSDELDEILNAFGDNADDHHHQENMFDLTNAFMYNSLSSSSEFLLEGDIWPLDELDEILNGFGDNADHNHHHYDDNMFDQLSPLSDPPRLSFTNAFIDNILDSTSDNWLAGTING